MTTAFLIICSSSVMRFSTRPWVFLASSYSLFSDRSPWLRASLISSASSLRRTVFRYSSSSCIAFRPAADILISCAIWKSPYLFFGVRQSVIKHKTAHECHFDLFIIIASRGLVNKNCRPAGQKGRKKAPPTEGSADRAWKMSYSTSPSRLRRATARVAAPSVCFAFARILLAAAPTAPPCFRHWRRSSLLPLPRGGLGMSGRDGFVRRQPGAVLIGRLNLHQTRPGCPASWPVRPRRGPASQAGSRSGRTR